MSARRFAQRSLVAALGFLVLASWLPGGAARASEGANALALYRPPADPFGYAAVPGAEALEAGSVFAAGHLSLARRPFRGRLPDGDRAAGGMHSLDVLVGVGVIDLFQRTAVQVGVALPVVVMTHGERAPDRPLDAGLGSARLEAKLGVGRTDDDPLVVGGRVVLTLPTGSARRWTADGDGLALLVEAGVEAKRSVVRVGLFLGYEWIEGRARVVDARGRIVIDDRFVLGFGLAVAPLIDLAGFEHVELFFEARHHVRASAPYRRSAEAPLEVGGGIRWRGERAFCLLGVSGGLGRGFGAPELRLALEVGVTF